MEMFNPIYWGRIHSIKKLIPNMDNNFFELFILQQERNVVS